MARWLLDEVEVRLKKAALALLFLYVGFMAKVFTLTKRADFLRLNRGRKFIADEVIVRAAANPDATAAYARVGYTVTTKCGSAVVRNRIKRRLRALVRELAPHVQAGMDYVLIARADVTPNAALVESATLRASLERAFTRIVA